MSTFDGYVKEFPTIAIDYFRPRHESRPAPAIYLLSHIHSDHLQGLESKAFGGGIIYCSAITKDLLLNLRTPQSRRSALEQGNSEEAYKYEHLRQHGSASRCLLRTLPINRPSKLCLGSEEVTVTLLDANHCPGAVMFLLESEVKCILYTGDVRAEDSFVVSLKNNALLSPYLISLRTLDCLYLDTSARSNGSGYKSNIQGCMDLVNAVKQYPPSMVFTFPARCLGYEKVLLTLARTFRSKIHVDDYTYELYRIVAETSPDSWEAAVYDSITNDIKSRFHSCGSWNTCQTVKEARIEGNEVYIKAVNAIKPKSDQLVEPQYSPEYIGETDFDGDLDLISYSSNSMLQSDDKVEIIGEKNASGSQASSIVHSSSGHDLPRSLVFSFARHSSWPEQHRLVSFFRPRDVQSCTGETSHEYVHLCRTVETEDPLEDKSTLPTTEAERRSQLIIQYYTNLGLSGWFNSPRLQRKRLCQDIDL